MKILLVDDESIVRHSMARMIGAMDSSFHIDEAEDGEEAIEKMGKQRYDLVITDIRMPGMNGLELLSEIRQKYTDTLVIILTGYTDFEYVKTALQHQAANYLLKPVSSENLHQVILDMEESFQKRVNHRALEQLREKNLLEKRVQDLLYELPLPYYDTSLIPEHDVIQLFSITADNAHFHSKIFRFSIKNIVKELLEPMGEVVIVVEEKLVTVTLFLKNEQDFDFPSQSEHVKGTLKQILKVHFALGYGGHTQQLSEIHSLYRRSLEELGLTDTTLEEKPPAAASHRLIRSALAIIEEEYSKELTLSLLAERLYVNPNYLSNLFRIETGITFTSHLTKVRMEKTKELLTQTNLKIYEICDQVGYGNQAHFSRLFKSIEGITPYQFREKHQKKMCEYIKKSKTRHI